MKSAIILPRVSTEDQKEDGTSLDGQINVGKAYIERNGYTLETRCGYAGKGLEYLPGVFQEDHTGKTAIRPAVNAALEAVETYGIKVVVLKNTRRLGRRFTVQETLEREFEARGARVEYVDAKFDRATVSGRGMRRVQGVFDEMDYENIIEQLRQGKYDRARQGSLPIGRAPYGYAILKERDERGKSSRKLIIEKEEAKIVNQIYNWYVYGDGFGKPLSITEIVKRLTADRIPTRWDTLGLKRKKHGAGVWSTMIVRKILRSTTYAGTWNFGLTRSTPAPGTDKTQLVKTTAEDWVGVSVPAIIERDLWEAVQHKIDDNKANAKRNRKYTYLFSCMLACEMCKNRFAGYDGYRPSSKKYRCCGRCRNVDPCQMPFFHEAELDAKVWPWICDLAKNIEKVERAINQREQDADEQNARIYSLIASTEKAIEEKQAERDRVFVLYKTGRLDAERWSIEDAACAKEIADHEAEKVKYQARLVKTQYTPEYFRDVKALCRTIAIGFDVFTLEEKREAYELLDFTAELAIEDGYKVAHVECVIDKERLEISATGGNIAFTSCSPSERNIAPLRLTARLVIGPVNRMAA